MTGGRLTKKTSRSRPSVGAPSRHSLLRSAISTGLAADHPDMPEIMQAIGEFVPMETLVRGLGYNVEWRERIAANAGTLPA